MELGWDHSKVVIPFHMWSWMGSTEGHNSVPSMMEYTYITHELHTLAQCVRNAGTGAVHTHACTHIPK